MKNKEEIDVLRNFMKMRLPGLRGTSLKTEVEILEDFIEKRRIDPNDKRYSRNYPGIPNIIYHLGRLEEAGIVESSAVRELAGFEDLAEQDPKLRIKRTRMDIQDVRELRVKKLLKHAETDETVKSILFKVLNVSSIKEAEKKISYSDNRHEERFKLGRYNEAVDTLQKAGIRSDEYNKLLWKNKPKPWKLKQSFVDYLKSNGVKMEG